MQAREEVLQRPAGLVRAAEGHAPRPEEARDERNPSWSKSKPASCDSYIAQSSVSPRHARALLSRRTGKQAAVANERGV